MLYRFIISCVFCLLTFECVSQTPSIEWERSYGGSKNDYAYSIIQTLDGGYLIAGSTRSIDGDISFNNGNIDVWVLKISFCGNIEWERTFGGPGREEAFSVKQTADGGFILAGYYTPDTSIQNLINQNSEDCLVLKIDSVGNLEWQKTYGGSLRDNAYDVVLTKNNSCIVLGNSYSNDGDVVGHHGRGDVWLFEIDNQGVILWSQCYGGSLYDYGRQIKPTSDGYVLGGYTRSNDGDITVNEGSNGWIFRINFSGEILWNRAVGNNDDDRFNALYYSENGGVAVGSSYYPHQFQFYLVKFDEEGNIIWQFTEDSMEIGHLYSVIETNRSGVLALGQGITKNTYGSFDYILRMFSSEGQLEWEMNLGGSKSDIAKHIIQTEDGGFIIAGMSESSDFDVSRNYGNRDIWIVKLSPEPLRIIGDKQACLEDTLQFKTNLNLQSNWYIDGQFQGYSDTLNLIFDTEGNHILRACYSVENKTYCDSLTIQVYNKPKVKFPDYVYSCEPFLSDVCPAIAGSVHTFMWHDGNRDSCRKFEAPGRVWLTVSNPACSATDSTWLVENKKPIYEVVQLDTFCLEGSNYNRVTIKPDTFPSINWNGGDGFQPVYWIYQNQMISVEVMDSNNCTKRSEFLPIDGCNTTFYIPNSFTPNGDGLNDVISVSGSRIASVYLRIYNRWGQQVFESKEVDKGWDGSLQGNQCPQDIYFYIVEYSGYLDNELFVKSEKGIIHLLR